MDSERPTSTASGSSSHWICRPSDAAITSAAASSGSMSAAMRPARCPDSILAASAARSDRNRSRTNSLVTACCSCSASVVSVA